MDRARELQADTLFVKRAYGEAAKAYDEVLRLDPHRVRCLNNLGLSLLRQGNARAAIPCFERALALKPDYEIARINLQLARQYCDPAMLENQLQQGLSLLRNGQAEPALRAFESALELRADNTQALLGATSALLRLGRLREALSCSERALRTDPSRPEVQANGAAVLLALRRPAAALRCAEAALAQRPDLFEAHYNRAEALLALGQATAAVGAFDQALALRPGFGPALRGRGHAWRELSEPARASVSYQAALRQDPADAAARIGLLMGSLPVIPANVAEVEASRCAFNHELQQLEQWLERQPTGNELAVIGVAQPFALAYQERNNRELLSRWGRICDSQMTRWAARSLPPRPRIPPHTDTRLRLGIVTAHLREHSVYQALIRGWLQHLDPESIRIWVFDLASTGAAAALRLPSHIESIDCAGRMLPERVAAIRERDCEVLLYPEVGMAPQTLQLASLRLARHQIAAWGHPETTGLPTLDYYLSAAAFEPHAAAEHYSEQLIELPRLGCCYEPRSLEPPIADAGPLPIAAGRPLLISAGMPFKYAPEYDDALLGIARAMPDCQIVLFEARASALSQRLCQRLRAHFHAGGADSACLVAVPWQSPTDFYRLLQQADLMLDTLGFSGFNTAMQAIECGLPIVAYEGRFMRGRFASGILRSLGLDHCVAATVDEYVQLAVRLVRDPGLHARVRAQIESRRPALYNDPGAVRALQEFLLGLNREEHGGAVAQ